MGLLAPRGSVAGFCDWIQWLVRQIFSRHLNVNAVQRSQGLVLQITAGQGLFDGLRCCRTGLRVLGGLSELNTSELTAGSCCGAQRSSNKDQPPPWLPGQLPKAMVGCSRTRVHGSCKLLVPHCTQTFRVCCWTSRKAEHRWGLVVLEHLG